VVYIIHPKRKFIFFLLYKNAFYYFTVFISSVGTASDSSESPSFALVPTDDVQKVQYFLRLDLEAVVHRLCLSDMGQRLGGIRVIHCYLN
jgi:hypothetical protein